MSEPDVKSDPFELVQRVVASRFRVIDLHAMGTTCAVYEVEPPGVGHARRALKVLRPLETREPQAMERLEWFIRRFSELKHPHLEQVFELGYLADETPFLLTEWLPGVTLDQYLQEHGTLSAAQAMMILRQVAQGLAKMHEAGLVHGDVLPQHILLMGHASIERAVLTNAGITSRLQTALPRNLKGPIAFWAPERLNGMAATIASDVYALGVLTYLLFSGQLPFLPEDTRASLAGSDPAARICWLHLNAEPPKLVPIAQEAEFLPQLEALIERSMAKGAGDRFLDACGFLDALNALQSEAQFPRLSVSDLIESSMITDISFVDTDNSGLKPQPQNEKNEEKLSKRGPNLYLWGGLGAMVGGLTALALRFL